MPDAGEGSLGGATDAGRGGRGAGQAGAVAASRAGAAGRSSAAGSPSVAGKGGSGAAGSTATAADAGGSPATGGVTSLDSVCPAFTGTGGTLLTPPSTSFEANVSGWQTVAQQTTPISLGTGSGNACDGSAYLVCSGSGRTNSWDGPKMNLFPYVVADHTYLVSIAARFDPRTAPASIEAIRLVCAKDCTDTSVATAYVRLSEQTTTYSWVRLSGQLQANLAGCPVLSGVFCYVETDTTAQTNTLHVDDFRIYDLTSTATGAGGSAGAGNVGDAAGASGSAGAGNVVGSAGALNGGAAGSVSTSGAFAGAAGN